MTACATRSASNRVYARLIGPVAAPGSALTPITLPTISGTARVGGELTSIDGPVVVEAAQLRLHLASLQRERPVSASRSRARPLTYRTGRAADAGHTLVVERTTQRPGGKSQSALTAATAPIVK